MAAVTRQYFAPTLLPHTKGITELVTMRQHFLTTTTPRVFIGIYRNQVWNAPFQTPTRYEEPERRIREAIGDEFTELAKRPQRGE